MSRVRVLLVDDSATVRAVLKRMLSEAPGVEVVGEADNGQQAVELAQTLQPDVVLMDLDLPVMDGYTASARINELCSTRIVVVTSQGQPEKVAAAFRAMKTGVVGILPKPELPEGWKRLSHDLEELIRQLGPRRNRLSDGPAAREDAPAAPVLAPSSQRVDIVAIGASTGGPGALCELLRQLARPLAAAIAVVQHIASGFEEGLIEWLRQELAIDVAMAADRAPLRPGTVRIAPAGAHLRVRPDGRLSLDRDTAPVGGHRPSADLLLGSLAELPAQRVAGVLLSGMGADGAQGMLALRRAGALTVVQDRHSCAVFGMPRAALEIGAAEIVLNPVEIGRLLDRVTRGESP